MKSITIIFSFLFYLTPSFSNHLNAASHLPGIGKMLLYSKSLVNTGMRQENTAKLCVFSSQKKKQAVKRQSEDGCIYFFILHTDGCYHLWRLTPPGYINPNGTYNETMFTLVQMNDTNYIGTFVFCLSVDEYDTLC